MKRFTGFLSALLILMLLAGTTVSAEDAQPDDRDRSNSLLILRMISDEELIALKEMVDSEYQARHGAEIPAVIPDDTSSALIDEYLARIEELMAAIAEKDVQIETLTIRLKDMESYMEMILEENTEKEARIDTLKEKLAEMTARLEASQAAAADQSAQIEAMNAQMSEMTRYIETLLEEITERDAQIEMLSAGND